MNYEIKLLQELLLCIPPNIKFIRDIANNNADEGGWKNRFSILFFEYIANHFYPWLQNQRIELPVIFCIDESSSNVTLKLSKFCREKWIELICVYLNATHLMDPLDTAGLEKMEEIVHDWSILQSLQN